MWELKAVPNFTKLDVTLEVESIWDKIHLRC